jgi:hypothetical protein
LPAPSSICLRIDSSVAEMPSARGDVAGPGAAAPSSPARPNASRSWGARRSRSPRRSRPRPRTSPSSPGRPLRPTPSCGRPRPRRGSPRRRRYPPLFLGTEASSGSAVPERPRQRVFRWRRHSRWVDTRAGCPHGRARRTPRLPGRRSSDSARTLARSLRFAALCAPFGWARPTIGFPSGGPISTPA